MFPYWVRIPSRCYRPDCPLFNAGKGAVFNTAGEVRLTRVHILTGSLIS